MRYRYSSARRVFLLYLGSTLYLPQRFHLQAIKSAPLLPGRSCEHDPLPVLCSSGVLLIYGAPALYRDT